MKQLIIAAFLFPVTVRAANENTTNAYNVIWDSPSTDAHGSMPIGNGDIGLNAWAQGDGTIHLLISKTDAWDNSARLVKVGKVVVRFDSNPFTGKFKQELDLKTGSILIQDNIRIWVDAHHPVIHLTSELPATATVELWRTKRQEIAKLENSDIMTGAPETLRQPQFIEPDTMVNATTWYHHNTTSLGPAITAKIQGLTGFPQTDPILDRIFGGSIVKTPQGIDIHVLTQQPSTPEKWQTDMKALIQQTGAADFAEHKKWWADFWDRSWIRASSKSAGNDAAHVSQMYARQRFVTACAGRGAYPIKFNGSIFTMPQDGDPDYRRWGPAYWWQNTRLPCYAMCSAGDFDLMRPLFHMYVDKLLPLCKYRTKHYFGHEGAYYPEVMYFWGAVSSKAYGWTPIEERTDRLQDSRFHKWEWVGGLELCTLLLDYCDHTGDRAFLEKTALPFCREILTFFDQHYKTSADGKLIMSPAQALETWWDCTNPMPEVAGCIAVTERLLALPGQPDAAFLKQFRAKLPALPLRDVNGKQALAPAERYADNHNIEIPELCAVFPFRLIAYGKPNLDWGIEALHNRLHKAGYGWHQDDLFMSYLGLADEARTNLVTRARTHDTRCRFPAFWGPGHDWTPDQCHGGVLMRTFQTMLLQTDGQKIHLMPAWPKEWDCDFKLHAPGQTVLAGQVVDGKVVNLQVTPESRRKDVVVRGKPITGNISDTTGTD